jgi:CheY-like chemotaxis protein
MLKMLRRLIGEQVELSWRPGVGLWRVRIDPAQVDQVLANLCVNARDAIDGVGTLTIDTANTALDDRFCAAHPGAVPGDHVRLVVRDTGRGMTPEVLANVFEPFFTTKPLGEGTGLGLATVYGIVKQNDGYIDVESRLGAGSAFSIYLPRCEAPRALDTRPHEPAPMPRGRETILLVEDEPAMLTMSARALGHLGYRVLTASSPAEALDLAARAGVIDLLLTDVIMPGQDGRTLADSLREQRPGLRVLFMSGYTADVLAPRGILTAAVQFLQKPFSMPDLAVAIRRALDSDAAPVPPDDAD